MSNVDERLFLQWNDFNESVTSAFGDLREDKEFTDVTLACEDGQHKVVLIASSPFFLKILRRNKHPHPLIYMRGVQPENLIALVEFFYRGQASVYQGNLDSFLALAKDLELKGLKGNQTEEDVEVNHPQTVSRDLSRVNQSGSDKYHQILSDLSCETDNVEPGTKVVDTPKHQALTNTDIESLDNEL